MEAWYRRSVDMAVEILGGSEPLARHLGVSLEEVRDWVQGKTEPAAALLQRIVDLIESSTVSAARTATVVRSRRDEGN